MMEVHSAAEVVCSDMGTCYLVCSCGWETDAWDSPTLTRNEWIAHRYEEVR